MTRLLSRVDRRWKRRALIGHFAPHAVLLYFLTATVQGLLRIIEHGFTTRNPFSGAPNPWTWTETVGLIVALVIITAAAIAIGSGYFKVRLWHDGHPCRWCDRTARTWGARRRAGALAWLFDARYTTPGAVTVTCAGLGTVVAAPFWPAASVLLNLGIALALLSTISHQARRRACHRHAPTVVFVPGDRWNGVEGTVRKIVERTRGADAIRVTCTWCMQRTTVTAPGGAIPWMWNHMVRPCRYKGIGIKRDSEGMIALIEADPPVEDDAEAPAPV